MSMSMSIQERMALQASLARNSHKVTPPAATAASASLSTAQRIARQGATARNDSATLVGLPPEPVAVHGLSAAERIAKQAMVAKEDSMRVGHGAGNALSDVQMRQLRSEYEAWLAQNMPELEGMEPMFFKPVDKESDEKTSLAHDVNGVSTAEGEMVMPAGESVPVGGLPYQATPVVTTPRVRSRRRTKAGKEDAAPVESGATEPAAG